MDREKRQAESNHSRRQLCSVDVTEDKHGLIREIGRLRLQLHYVQTLDNSKERIEFLRNEISQLKTLLERRSAAA